MEQVRYEDEFFKRLIESPDLKVEEESFKRVFGNPLWWIIELTPDGSYKMASRRGELCDAVTCKGKEKFRCLGALKEALNKAKETKHVEVFRCEDGGCGFCEPLIQGDKLYGFMILCNLTNTPTQESLSIFSACTKILMREVQREMELATLYETIRPRAIALSTIHTIHRLISSVLDMDELLPKVARLVLQVLRARRAEIMLIDKKKRALVPKAVVDLDERVLHARSIPLKKGPVGKVARTGNAYLEKDILSVPLLHEEIIGVLTVARKVDRSEFTTFDKEILSTLAEQAVIAIHNAQLYEEQSRITIGSIRSLAMILDTKSPYTYTHSNGFVKLVLAMGLEMGLSGEAIRNLHYAALLPDAGKLWVPEEILGKASKLTGREYKIIREHPIRGVEIIKHIDVLKPCMPIVLHHHERYDGTGYPKGLKGDEIPLGARIMAVADAFEAMLLKRPYRKAKSISQAVSEIRRFAGTQFDPKVVAAFLKLYRKGKVKSIWKGNGRGEK